MYCYLGQGIIGKEIAQQLRADGWSVSEFNGRMVRCRDDAWPEESRDKGATWQPIISR